MESEITFESIINEDGNKEFVMRFNPPLDAKSELGKEMMKVLKKQIYDLYENQEESDDA